MNGLPVYAFHKYLLKSGLSPTAGTQLIASPTAQFIRGFGGTGTGDMDNVGNTLVATDNGDQPGIRISGGIWGVKVGNWKTDITFSPGSPNRIAFAGAKARFFNADGSARADVLPQLWVYKQAADRTYPTTLSKNNNLIFTVTGFTDADTLTVAETPASETVQNMMASYLPRTGHSFVVNSTGGVLRDISLINPRGIQFILHGDGFELSGCTSRNAPPDAGGGVRFGGGYGMRGTMLDLECSDDCFQFNPGDNDGVQRGSFTDCLGKTNQGALIAFINGNGKVATGTDSLSTCRDNVARNIRGTCGGSQDHGGVAIKVYCANSSIAASNLWVEDVYVRQADGTPPNSPRAGVQIITGRAGILASGLRNVVIENRAGPLIGIVYADLGPDKNGHSYAGPLSTMVEFTAEQAGAPGAGSWPGPPLISAPFAARLVLRDIWGDLSGAPGNSPGRAFEIGTKATYGAFGTVDAGPIGNLVIERFAVTNAALPSTTTPSLTGLWQIGNCASARVSRLQATKATAFTGSLGGIELRVPMGGTGPTFCLFDGVDFTGIDAPVAVWQNQVGNAIENSVGFDDERGAVTVAAGANAIDPPSYFTAIGVQAAAATIVNRMAPPPAPSPAPALPQTASPVRTLTLANKVTLSGQAVSGQPASNLTLAGDAAGPDAAVTLQWRANQMDWLEVARSPPSPAPISTTVSTGPSKTLVLPSYPPVILVSVTGGGSGTVNNITPPPSGGAPRCTLMLGVNVMVAATPSPSNLVMGATLSGGTGSGGSGANITFQWRADLGTSGSWLEVGRFVPA